MLFEVMVTEISLGKKKNCIVYRLPSSPVKPFFSKLHNFLHQPHFQGKDVILSRGFNIDLLEASNESSVELLSSCFSAYLLPTFLIPTRISPSSVSLIDNIFTSLPIQANFAVLNDILDHFLLVSDLAFTYKILQVSKERQVQLINKIT